MPINKVPIPKRRDTADFKTQALEKKKKVKAKKIKIKISYQNPLNLAYST